MSPPEHLDFLVPEHQAGISLGQMLAEIAGIDHSKAKALVRAGAVLHDRQRPRDPRFRVRGGARIRAALTLPPAIQVDLAPLILHRGPHVLVVDKPAGVPSAPTRQSARGTLPELLREQLGLSQAPRAVHRLDREVSGVMALALTGQGARQLSDAFARDDVVKEYLALVSAPPPSPEAQITAPVGQDPARRGRMRVHPGGAPSRTDYRVLPAVGPGDAGGMRLLCLRLHTGRTHQIRVHLAHLGCPIVGDLLYGGPKVVTLDGERIRARRLCLRSIHLQLPGEAIGRPSPVSFRVKPPSTLLEWLEPT